MSGRIAAVISAVIALSACSSSPPSRFYTLNVTPPAAPPAVALSYVSVDKVTIPGEIDRPELVRRTGPNQLEIAGFERWAAPLDEAIQRVLADDVSRRNPSPVAGPTRSISVDIHEFYGDAACNVTLRAAWTVRQLHAGGAPVQEDIEVPASGACPAALAATMSTALGQLGDRIVAGVARIAPAADQ